MHGDNISLFLLFREAKRFRACAYLVDGNNFSIGLLDLPQLHQEIPEPRFSNDHIRSKNPHAVELWCWVCVCWEMAANDLVLLESACSERELARLLRYQTEPDTYLII